MGNSWSMLMGSSAWRPQVWATASLFKWCSNLHFWLLWYILYFDIQDNKEQEVGPGVCAPFRSGPPSVARALQLCWALWWLSQWMAAMGWLSWRTVVHRNVHVAPWGKRRSGAFFSCGYELGMVDSPKSAIEHTFGRELFFKAKFQYFPHLSVDSADSYSLRLHVLVQASYTARDAERIMNTVDALLASETVEWDASPNGIHTGCPGGVEWYPKNPWVSWFWMIWGTPILGPPQTYVYTCIYVYMYISIYVYMYICIYVHMYICICIYVYMYIFIYVHIYICIYLYIIYYILYIIYIWYIICYILYVICYMLYVICYILYIIYHIWYIICYMLYVICYMLYVIYYILYIIYYMLYIIYYILYIIYYILYIIYYILYIILYYIVLYCIIWYNICTYIHTYITLHYITLHYITLHYITLDYIHT